MACDTAQADIARIGRAMAGEAQGAPGAAAEVQREAA